MAFSAARRSEKLVGTLNSETETELKKRGLSQRRLYGNMGGTRGTKLKELDIRMVS